MKKITEIELINGKLLNILTKVKQINSDVEKQSFGDLILFENFIEETLRFESYKTPNWFFKTPRWLGEYGNTAEEEELLKLLYEATFVISDIFKGGWGECKSDAHYFTFLDILKITDAKDFNYELEHFLQDTKYIPSKLFEKMLEAYRFDVVTSIEWLNNKLKIIEGRIHDGDELLNVYDQKKLTFDNYNEWMKEYFQ